jgi:hypothetical protein
VRGLFVPNKYGWSEKFDEPITVHMHESMSYRRLTDEEAATARDLDFRVLSGAEILDALGCPSDPGQGV